MTILTIACGRERLRDDAALDLARGRARDGVGDVNLLRTLEVGQPLLAERQQLGLGGIDRSEHDRRRDLLTPRRMRHAEADRLGHRGVREQHLVNLARRDLLAAAIDHLLEPSGQRQIAVLVEESLVAGPEPAIDERRGVGLGVVLVPADHVGSLDDDLAPLAGRQVPALGVHDADAARPCRGPTEPGSAAAGGSGFDAI